MSDLVEQLGRSPFETADEITRLRARVAELEVDVRSFSDSVQAQKDRADRAEARVAKLDAEGDRGWLHAKEMSRIADNEKWRAERAEAEAAALRGAGGRRLWLWKNFVDGQPEYWAFDNPFPVNLDSGDPQTLGEPCGYAIFKPSRVGRADVPEAEVLERIKRAKEMK